MPNKLSPKTERRVTTRRFIVPAVLKGSPMDRVTDTILIQVHSAN